MHKKHSKLLRFLGFGILSDCFAVHGGNDYTKIVLRVGLTCLTTNIFEQPQPSSHSHLAQYADILNSFQNGNSCN